MKRAIHLDVYVSGIFLVLSVFMYSKTFVMHSGAALFPKILLIALFCFSIITFFRGIKKSILITGTRNQKEMVTHSKLMSTLLALMIFIIYAILIKYLGFFISTTLFIMGFMKFCGVQNFRKILISVIIADLLIYAIFVVQLNIFFPKGILF